MANIMEIAERRLCASLIYRALLDSILERGRSKAYIHGAEYLKRLDKLSESISNWNGFSDHEAYRAGLRGRTSRAGMIGTVCCLL
jgi:hypothetical protein